MEIMNRQSKYIADKYITELRVFYNLKEGKFSKKSYTISKDLMLPKSIFNDYKISILQLLFGILKYYFCIKFYIYTYLIFQNFYC